MESSLVWITLIGYVLVQNIAFFLLFLTQKAAPKVIRQLLAMIALCCAIILIEEFVGLTYGFENHPHFYLSTSPFWFLLAPLIYLYYRTQSTGSAPGIKDLWHIIPFVAVIVLTLPFYNLPAYAKFNYLTHFRNGQFTAPVHNISYLIFFFQAIGYFIASFFLFRKNQFEKHKKSWHRILLTGLIALSLIGIFSIWSANAKSQLLLSLCADLWLIWITLFNLVIFIQLFRQPKRLFFKYKSAGSSQQTSAMQNTFQLIDHYFQEHASYQNPDFNIHHLSQVLGFSKNHLERSIKESTQLNFRDYLNTYRIKAAKSKLLLPESKQFTIQSIAEEVGFRSPATFYRAFKKWEGQTPKEWLASH